MEESDVTCSARVVVRRGVEDPDADVPGWRLGGPPHVESAAYGEAVRPTWESDHSRRVQSVDAVSIVSR
jgi:hypothetical protein